MCGMEKSAEIPAAALRFAALAVIGSIETSSKRQRTLEGVACSGDLLTGHWFWSAVLST